MLIPNTHYEPAHNAAHTYYELGYGHYELYSGSTMSSPYAMRAEPRALAPAAVPLAARYRPARRPALSHSTARRSLQCTAAPPRLAAPLATSSLAAPLAAPLAALLTAPLRSLHRSPCPARRAARRAAR